MEKKYWQSFGELNQSEAYNKEVKDEFKEELPFVGDESKSFLETAAPRRDFLKYLGFSTAAAAVAASCEMPVKKAIPFANKPEDIVPGISNYYATTYVQDGDVVSVLAKVRDGRPIKIEGNDLSPITKGGTSARVQASVLDLYDTARLRFPTIDGKEVTFEAIDKALAGAVGGNVVILTSTITSPSTKAIIAEFLAKNPGSRHVTYDAVSYSAMLQANEATYGVRGIPSYHFENAKAIVSLGADFLGTWLSPVEFSKQYASGKKIDEKNPSMSKHIHFESVASLTGSNADEKYLHRPSETGAIAAALLSAVNGQAVTGISDAKLKAGIEKAAKALNENKGAALVVAGSNDVNVQIIVNAINNAIGAGGTTINWGVLNHQRAGVDADFVRLVEDMNAGIVNTLLVYGANPAYTWFDAEKFKAGLKKVRTTVSFASKVDETAELCKFVVPDHHYLESWGDAEAKTGHFSFIQPTIYPLFKTRQWQDSLLKWSGNTSDYLAYLKNFWSAKLGGQTGWDKALQDGVISIGESATKPGSFNGAAVGAAVAAATSGKKAGKYELVLYEKVGIGAGQGASNPWLQELPDPVTRATWDNYVIVSPALARTMLDIDLNNGGQADAYEVNPPKKVVKVVANGKEISLPVLIIPGTHPDTIGIAVGYGRSNNIGKAAAGVGQNAFPLASISNGVVSFSNSSVEITVTGEKYPVALTQTHNRYDTTQGNRTEVMKELTLADYKKHPTEIREERDNELKPWGGLEKFESQGTIYPVFDRPGIKWGMSVDLNTCTGCGACVVACNAENNVSVVGKPEVLRGHEMHWLRIDRYYSGDMDNPNVVFQPLMCQHCDNAPCENVCPVAATNHSSEGINQMTYNRCIGTRYCANNCPYKVRRFNWSDYTGSDSFGNNQEGIVNDVVLNMNDDLTRMVLNPDVTVRSRGVIEKCSFCVQRLQESKLKAKKESRPMVDSDIKVACQQACPTNAITFGNANDKHSAITMVRTENPNRQFYVLEQLHVLPGVTYLAKVRNTESAHGEGKHETKKEAEHA
ncbi:MAG: TAT-variant-translocated molybdopterin oxidoreductase [Sediminibacterium sp. Gen4]|jgi:MoCo/4Fe-4S cofactor protein with predicted Tat translocation signal|uniref:TAT-variant-translocated molybdopterin oxidoreductase n=1 Tax=unclassified Sediminibacterium TaxID=2635961 RepID=UPI0015BE5906|nr:MULTISPECIES: TAT-variant-translocated molybdopterin oxidoreductase [unclassified Sediminibacterium]MBW0163055.1 TAT-variant-translocated molybdopterin oxidoreductase [Sediminibacterium sp.]NWK66373.1 TAT-variant-translocated molybdopterin oxidoreductase [Sediminibacterium sp. Gen4]